MAVKRKRPKLHFNPVVRGKAVRLKRSEATAVSEDAPDPAALEALPTDGHSSFVMLVITLLALAFITFIIWSIAQMPVK